METTRIEKRIGIRAPAERIWDFVGDFARWNEWNPYETEVSGHFGFGAPISLIESLPGLPSRQVEARLGDWQPQSQMIWSEKRGFLFSSVRFISIEQLAPQSCILSQGVNFSGLRGELFHDKHKARIRTAYEELCENLKRMAEA